MKRCPECGRDYNDDSMSYCLDEGFELLFGPASMDEPATAILSEAGTVATEFRPDDAGTRQRRIADDDTAIFLSGAEPRESLGGPREKQNGSANSLAKPLIAVVVAAVVLIGGYFGYRYLTPPKQIESIAVMPFVNESGKPRL